MTSLTTSTAAIAKIADAVMRGVVKSGVIVLDGSGENIDRAIVVMREELKALLFSDGYEDERACLLVGTVSEATVVASVVLSCVNKLAV